jgi:hypothetical protein
MTYKKTTTTLAIVALGTLGLGLLASFVGQALAATAIENIITQARTQGATIPSLAQDQRIPGTVSGTANELGGEVSAIAHPVTK